MLDLSSNWCIESRVAMLLRSISVLLNFKSFTRITFECIFHKFGNHFTRATSNIHFDNWQPNIYAFEIKLRCDNFRKWNVDTFLCTIDKDTANRMLDLNNVCRWQNDQLHKFKSDLIRRFSINPPSVDNNWLNDKKKEVNISACILIDNSKTTARKPVKT